MADVIETLTLVLGLIISVFVLGTFVWRIAVWQNGRLKKDAEDKERLWKEYAAGQAKIVKEEFDKSVYAVRTEINDLSAKVAKQLRRQTKRSDFTNSNVQKVRMDNLDHQVELHRMQKAMISKGIEVGNGDSDSLFEREIKRKRTEIENDARQQESVVDDDEY